VSSFSSRCSRSNCGSSCASKVSRVCPSTPPLPRFAFTFSQAISKFFRLYTLSINEWTFLAPVRLIQSTSLLRRECTGFSLKELFLLLIFTHLASSLFLTVFVGRLPRPTSVAGCPVTWLSPRFRYSSAVRLLTERRSPLRFRL
jgi:hypothetical protein